MQELWTNKSLNYISRVTVDSQISLYGRNLERYHWFERGNDWIIVFKLYLQSKHRF